MRIFRRLGLLLSISITVTLLSVPVVGQTAEGTISGAVMDATGGVIPGAEVNIKHVETGAVRLSITNDQGRYRATALPIGTYELSVELAGFKRSVQTGIKLNVADSLRVDLTLEIGEVTELVTVEAGVTRIQSETSELSDVIEGEQITELAINGRNFVSLATLTTGVSNQTGDSVGVGVTGGTGGVVINGQRGNYVNWTVDGAQNEDVGNQASLSTYPAVEAIGEFRVLTSNYSAEFGTAGSGIVAAATKSGGQQFHGSVYEFHRNVSVAAAPFFVAYDAQGEKIKSPLILNNFGYTLGGPFFIPGHYNEDKTKDFFFWSQEWKIRRSGSVVRATTPTQAMRGGDFTGFGPITDPLTGEQFQNNIIPSDRINPESAKLMPFFPLPNISGEVVDNFNMAPSVPQNFRQELIRWDHNFTDNVKVMGRFTYDSFDDTPTTTLWTNQSFPNINATINTPGLNYIIKLTHVMSPTLVHEFNYNHAGNNIDIVMNGQFERPGDLNVPQLFSENRANRIPNLIMGQGYGNLNTGSWPWQNLNDVLTWEDKWTWSMGDHGFKFGGMYTWQRKNQDAFGPTQGEFNFSGKFTGNAVADFLLGYASTYSELDVQREGLYRYWQFEAFFQDDWKITPRLTLNLGLRYFLIPHLYEKENKVSAFMFEAWDPAMAPELVPETGAIIPGSGDLLNGVVQAGQGNLPKELTRTSKADFAPRVGFSWDPTGNRQVVVRGGYGIGYYRTEGNDTYNFINNPPFARNVSINEPLIDNLAAGGVSPDFASGISRFEDLFDPPQVHQWSFGLQFDTAAFVPNSMFEISYVGSRTIGLPLARDVNQPLPVDGYDFDPEINLGKYSTNYYRPYMGWAEINQRETSGQSNYNSLQVGFDKRFSEGFKFQVAYTYGQALNNASQFDSMPQDSYNAFDDYSLAQWDVTHNMTINYIYELPFFREQEGFVGRVLGGWQVSGITLFQSGTMSTVGMSLPNTGLADRPDLMGRMDRPKTINEWFSTGVFAQPEYGYFGDTGRNTVRGPGIHKWDVSLFKNNRVPWFGNESANLQFRAEFFNAPNHPIFSAVSTNLGAGNFGRLTSTRDPRIIQFGLKLDF